MEYIQEITLDLNADSVPVLVSAKQDDELSRKLKIYLMSDGEEYQPEPDAMVLVRAKRPDGTYLVDGAIASIDNNIVEVTLTQDMLYAPGRALVDIVLYNGSQYLSTASFILKIQPSPSEVMNMAVPTDGNDYPVFLTLMSALGSIEPIVSSAAAEAVAASNSAWAAVSNINENGILISTGSILVPGTSTSIIEKTSKNNFVFHAPTVKPHATASIQLIQDADPLVEVSYSTCEPSGSEDSNLLVNFGFNFTLPKNTLDIALSNTFTAEDSGKAGDAAAIGSFVVAATTNIPLTALVSDYVIPIEHGGIGVSIDTAASSSEIATAKADACTNIGAQRAIQVCNDKSLASGASWALDTSNSIYTQTIYIPCNNISLGDRVPEFVASPKDIGSWNEAADIGMGPPSAAAPASATNWPLTFQAESSSTKNINITVYWW